MSATVKVALAAAAFVPLAGLVGLLLLFGGGASGGAALTSALRPDAVPAQADVAWITKAGSLCPQISAPLIAAQIQTESDWDPTAVSSTGAQGLAQFEPGTWPAYGADDAGDGNVSPDNPPDAIMAEGRYLCSLASAVAPLAAKTGQPVVTLTLDAYNAGLGAVEAYGGLPPFNQTQQYAPKVEQLAASFAAAPAGGVAGSANSGGGVAVGSSGGGAAPGGLGGAIVQAAATQLGVPYVWGGGSPVGPTGGGFDCSGLVLYVVFQASQGAIALPHLSEDQATLGARVAAGPGDQVLASGLVQPGDAIAFALNGGGDYDHIGIYVGNGEMIAAPQTGESVDVENLATPYWEGVAWDVRRFA